MCVLVGDGVMVALRQLCMAKSYYRSALFGTGMLKEVLVLVYSVQG